MSGSMRILALSDIHAEENTLDRLRTVAMRSNYDLVIIAGDLTNNGPESFAQELLDLFPDNLLCVHGNMDPPNVIDLLSSSKSYIHGKKVKIGGWNFVGLGGSNPTPFRTPSEYSEDEIARLLAVAGVDEYTILVSHPPPKGILDNIGTLNVGSSSVRDCIEKSRPILTVCGHIHEVEGQKIVGDTLVVKLGPASSLRAAEITIADEISVNFITF
jgi:uncharacterized protein